MARESADGALYLFFSKGKIGGLKMAAIAKFISYDGGIAFSDSVVKFQKRERDGKLFPNSDIVSMGIRKPRQDADGFIRIVLQDKKMYRLFFKEEQLEEAIQFKKAFDALIGAAADAVPASVTRESSATQAPPAESAPEKAGRSGKKTKRPAIAGPKTAEKPHSTHRWIIPVIILIVIAIALAAVALLKKMPVL